MTGNSRFLNKLLALTLAFLVPSTVAAQTATLPAGTPVYGELDEQVTSKKKETTVGDVVRARVWRDVVVDGRVLIKAGSPLVARVSHVKPAKIAGRKGEVFIDALSATSVDGNEVLLDGGYDKSGKGNKALAWSLFALVAWPLIFIKGKQAVLDPGTVFDASVQSNVDVAVEARTAFSLRVGEPSPELSIEVLYDDMDPDAKQKILPMSLTVCNGAAVNNATVVSVNEAGIDAIPVTVTGSASESNGCTAVRATTDLEKLAKTFKKGINRFVIETSEGLQAEVILEIEL